MYICISPDSQLFPVIQASNMQVRSKKPVWFLFKFLEVILSLACCLIHFHCKHYHRMPHIFLLCGTYGGSVIVGFLALIGSLYVEKPKMVFEAAHSGILGAFHLITMFGQMHMELLKPSPDKKWFTFYFCSRDNSIVAMNATAVYFLHLCFALDLMYSHQPTARKHPDRGKRPLKLFFISPGVEEYVSRFRWFQHLANRRFTSAQPSEHSSRARNVSFDSESEEEPRVTVIERPKKSTSSAKFRTSIEQREREM